MEEATERALLIRRIRNQRKELRRLNQVILSNNRSIRYWQDQIKIERTNCYRHAANIAQSYIFGGRIAKYIRLWG